MSNSKNYTSSDLYGSHKQNTQPPIKIENQFVAMILWIVSAISLNIEIFLRRDFGERYLSLNKAIFGFSALIGISVYGFLLFSSIFSFSSRRGETYDLSITPYLLWTVIFIYIVHLVRIFLRNRKGEYKHSYYMGKSLSFIDKSIKNSAGLKKFLKSSLISNFLTQVVIEPLFVFILGLFLFYATIFKLLGIILIILSIFFFIKMQIIYQKFKNRILDIKDGQVVSRHLNDVVNNKTENGESHGLTVLNLSNEAFAKISTKEAIEKSFAQNSDLDNFNEETPVRKNKVKTTSNKNTDSDDTPPVANIVE